MMTHVRVRCLRREDFIEFPLSCEYARSRCALYCTDKIVQRVSCLVRNIPDFLCDRHLWDDRIRNRRRKNIRRNLFLIYRHLFFGCVLYAWWNVISLFYHGLDCDLCDDPRILKPDEDCRASIVSVRVLDPLTQPAHAHARKFPSPPIKSVGNLSLVYIIPIWE